MRKILKFVLSGFILLLVVCIVIMYKTLNKDNNETNVYTDTSQYLYSASEDRYELIQKVCEKNGNWDNYYLSKKFRKKYNEKDGYFGKIKFDKVEVQPYTEEEYPFAIYPHIVLTQGKKKTVFVYKYKYSNNKKDPGLEDIIISYSLQLTDEYGNKLDAKSIFIDEMKSENLLDLARGNDFEKNVAVTDKFNKKYPFFLDLFIHYSPRSYNKIDFIEKESDLDNDIAVFEINSILECKKRKYEVKLIFDDKLYLDDAEVKLVKEEDYGGNNQYTTLKILYKNSNWDNIKITDNYRKKFKGNSFIENIENIDINYFSESKKIANHEFLRKYRTINGNFEFYYGKYIYTQDDRIDDVICVKLNYDSSLSIDEAMEKYLIEQHY